MLICPGLLSNTPDKRAYLHLTHLIYYFLRKIDNVNVIVVNVNVNVI